MNVMQVAVSGLLLGGVYALMSIGLTLIFGVVRNINFAHGELLMVAMYATFWLFTLFNMDPYLSVLVVAPLLFLFGVLVQRVVVEPILDSPALMKVFVTVGLSIALQNLALMLWAGDFRSVRTPYSTHTLQLAGISISTTRLVAFGVSLLLMLALFLLLKHTFAGKALRAVAEDRGAAELMGINVKRLYLLAFGLGSALTGVAGALLMPIFYVFPTVGGIFTLIAFVVVVLGGMGNMMGAMLGGLIIGLIESFSGAYISPALKEAVYFVIFILVLLVRPQGLFGLGKGTEEVGLR